MTDVTNRAFLADLTRGQLLALAVQKAQCSFSRALGMGDKELRNLLETVKDIQIPVQA